MAESIGMAAQGRAPWHLWAVGVVSALWNCFGAVDYTMSQTRNAAYLAQFPPEMAAYLDSFPAAIDALWAFGVWSALAGSLLLLARSRFAVLAFIVSLAGLASTTVWQFVLTTPPEAMMTPPTFVMNAVIWAIAIALLVYALRMRAKGVLR